MVIQQISSSHTAEPVFSVTIYRMPYIWYYVISQDRLASVSTLMNNKISEENIQGIFAVGETVIHIQ